MRCGARLEMGCVYSKTRGNKRRREHLVPFLDVDVYVEADDRCSFSGITCLSGGCVVVADYLSHQVKYYDWKTLKLLDYIELSSPPYEVCTSALDPRELYVTVPFDHKMLHLRANESKLELVQEIPTEGRCYGVASFLEGLAISLRIDQHIWQIEVLSYGGSVMKVFKDDEHGHELFGFADYIAVDNDGTRLYVTDGLANAVFCYDLKNASMTSIKEIFKYTDALLKIPKGLQLDALGNLYIVGCESCNMHKVSPTGEKLGAVLGHKDQLENPMGVTIDNTEHKVFVTEGSRKVMIFKEP